MTTALLAVNGTVPVISVVDTQRAYVDVYLNLDPDDAPGHFGDGDSGDSEPLIQQLASNPADADVMFVTVAVNSTTQRFGYVRLSTGAITYLSYFHFRIQCE